MISNLLKVESNNSIYKVIKIVVTHLTSCGIELWGSLKKKLSFPFRRVAESVEQATKTNLRVNKEETRRKNTKRDYLLLEWAIEFL